MARFVAVTDFESGEFLISAQDQTADLEAVIDRLEEQVLQDLLGKELYDLFIADLDGSPTIPQAPLTARFLDIYNPIFETDPIYIRSEGFIKMLQMFIWFEYTKDLGKQNTPVGYVQNEFANGVNLSANKAGIEKTYNRGVKSFHAVLDYIIQDSTTYPEWDGQGKVKEFISWL